MKCSSSDFSYSSEYKPSPAGISLPVMTFSFKPVSRSIFPLMDASVKIRAVSWNDAAVRNDLDSRAALVIPRRIGSKLAGVLPERIKSLYPDLIYMKLTNNMFPEKVVGSVNLQTGQSIPPDFAKTAIMQEATEEERKAIEENIQSIYDIADTVYER